MLNDVFTAMTRHSADRFAAGISHHSPPPLPPPVHTSLRCRRRPPPGLLIKWRCFIIAADIPGWCLLQGARRLRRAGSPDRSVNTQPGWLLFYFFPFHLVCVLTIISVEMFFHSMNLMTYYWQFSGHFNMQLLIRQLSIWFSSWIREAKISNSSTFQLVDFFFPSHVVATHIYSE